MKSFFTFLFVFLFIICVQSFSASATTTPSIGGDKDAHGCMVGAGYSWNKEIGKCVRPWLPLFCEKDNMQSLKLGSRGTDVKELQDFLIKQSYLEGTSTSYFGAKTQMAVKLFQKKMGVKQTGVFGSLSKEALCTR